MLSRPWTPNLQLCVCPALTCSQVSVLSLSTEGREECAVEEACNQPGLSQVLVLDSGRSVSLLQKVVAAAAKGKSRGTPRDRCLIVAREHKRTKERALQKAHLHPSIIISCSFCLHEYDAWLAGDNTLSFHSNKDASPMHTCASAMSIAHASITGKDDTAEHVIQVMIALQREE